MIKGRLTIFRSKSGLVEEENSPNVTIIKKAILDGTIPLDKVNDIVKAMNHKYIRKEPDGKGGFTYIYEEKKVKAVKQDFKGSLKEKLEKFLPQVSAKNYPNVSEFVVKVMPEEYVQKYKELYELASSVGISVNIENGVLPYGMSATWHMGQINIDPFTSTMFEDDWESFVETINHETIHGIISKGVSGGNFKLHTELASIWKTIQSNFDKANDEVKQIISYIADTANEYKSENFETGEKVGDLEELVTYAFTNKPFAEFLQSIPADPGKVKKGNSIFSKLKNIIKGYITKVAGDTKLDEITTVVEKYFDIDWNVKNYGERNEKYDWGKKFKVDDIEKGILGNNGESVIKAVEEILNEGRADGRTIEEIAWHHKVPIGDIEDEFSMGFKVEKEHTDSDRVAGEITRDHLWEIPDYYTRLKKMEKEAKADIHKSYLQDDITDEEYEQGVDIEKKIKAKGN